MARRREDLFKKLRRHLPPHINPENFADEQCWIWQTPSTSKHGPRLVHDGRDLHPVIFLMEHILQDQTRHPTTTLPGDKFWPKRGCGLPSCINPRHFALIGRERVMEVDGVRKNIPGTSRFLQFLDHPRYEAPAFDWPIDALYKQLYAISPKWWNPKWYRAEFLHAKLEPLDQFPITMVHRALELHRN